MAQIVNDLEQRDLLIELREGFKYIRSELSDLRKSVESAANAVDLEKISGRYDKELAALRREVEVLKAFRFWVLGGSAILAFLVQTFLNLFIHK
jgi:hypothetical protein